MIAQDTGDEIIQNVWFSSWTVIEKIFADSRGLRRNLLMTFGIRELLNGENNHQLACRNLVK